MRLGFRIAGRFLRSNMGQTILIIFGIAVGVSVQIFIGSLIQGLQKSLIEKTIGNSPQITITSTTENKRIENYDEILTTIKAKDGGIEALSVASDNAAFLEYGENSQSLLVRGFPIQDADSIYHFIDSLTEGRYPEAKNEIILGTDLKKEYEISNGDLVKIITPGQKITECKVVGFFDLGVATINKNWGIVTLDTAAELFDTGDTVTSIEMQVPKDRVFTADETAAKIAKELNGKELKVDNWKAQNEQLLSGLQGQSVSSLMIQIFVMISVVLAIASVLAITVMQKSRQIGILKAMGIPNSTTGYVFLSEGLILGFFGALTGVALGLLLAFSFTKFVRNPDGTPVIALYIDYAFVTMSGCIAILASMGAALIPAIRSSRLNPIDIIRNN